jgi:hypothetical protein
MVGMLELDCTALFSAEGDQRLVLHTAAPGSETAGRLELLRVLGLQQLGDQPHGGSQHGGSQHGVPA